MDRVDILTGTFGKALGGASGGYTAARQPIVDLLRQRSRPYLFSNTVAPAICAATIRTQISAGHTREDIDLAVKAFGEVKKEMGL